MDLRRLRVLVAEDEGLVAAGIKAQTIALGHEVVGIARDGEEAVAMAESLSPDLILMDIVMPRLSGLEAAQRILARRYVPIILLSAHSEVGMARQAAEIGIYSYLLKPIDRKDLLPAIEVALSRFEEMQVLRREVADLKGAIRVRKIVEQAKGILMKRLHVSEAEAFRRLQHRARSTRRSLHEVAEEVVRADAFFAEFEESP